MPKPKDKDYLKITDVPALLKKMTGQSRTRQTVYNWMKLGRRTYSGEHIILTVSRRSGQFYTTENWVKLFVEQL